MPSPPPPPPPLPGPTSTTSSSSSSSSSGPSDAERMREARERLRASYREILRRWGFRPNKNLLNLMERGLRSMWSTTQFTDMLRQTPEYHQQFRGIRWRQGMTEGQYLSTFGQYKARAQDIGEKLSKKEFAVLLKNGKSFEEYSATIDAINSIDSYAPFWGPFQQVLELRGVAVPGKKLTKAELVKFAMGLGSPKWEQIWQETMITTQLERVAGIQVVAQRAGETMTPDSYDITRKQMIQIVNQAEALNPGFEVENLTGKNWAGIGERLRGYSISYLQRYGMSTKDLLEMELGGPRAAEIAEKGKRILATQEAFVEGPRAVPQQALV